MPEHCPGDVTILFWQGNMEHICLCNKMVSQYPPILHGIVKAFLILLVFLCLLENGGLVEDWQINVDLRF